ncbi:hypothetical protein E1287_04250 [Actinomadura sp. KC06]|uniref:hypothetical protein n=1 Tax=Actinomadura sp. KC06 TaxID=2530369 RepID=UPI0010490E59|nr:hypothetical protein [Actinomadura sp. KC06]TDD39027.1 hypothetical protein E1287_04250 [Actinomadura sp. KC06]
MKRVDVLTVVVGLVVLSGVVGLIVQAKRPGDVANRIAAGFGSQIGPALTGHSEGVRAVAVGV